MKKHYLIRFLTLVTALALMIPATHAGEEDVMEQIAKMTLKEKVGQLFMIRPDALEGRFSPAELEDNSILGTIAVTDEMRAVYAEYPCGGFTLFRKNITDPAQLLELTEALHGLGNIRPILSIDEEGGRVARLGNHPAFNVPKILAMQVLAASRKPERAFEAGNTIGGYLRNYGLDLDFAPVADVNTNPRNPVIGDRAFGSKPEIAAQMVAAYLNGLHSQGIAGCIKHFPGHGDTSTDTHTGYAETLKTWDELKTCEMLPFMAGIEAGADLVMTAHIAAPNITGSSEPSTVSYTILTEKLRGELGYDGIIITDALSMGAITQAYAPGEVCVRCLQAGVDILLMPLGYQDAFRAVMAAVEQGEISEARIDESVRRILTLKQQIANRSSSR